MRNRLAITSGLAGALVLAVVGTGTAPAAAEEQQQGTYGRMMLVLDSSGSMKEPAGGGTTKIQAAKQALDTVIDDLPESADVGMRVFGAKVFGRKQKGACQDTQLVVEPGTGNRDDLRSAVSGYKPYGETPIPIALERAAEDIGAEGKRSIVLVSDGESTCGDPCPAAQALADKGIDLQIDVVGLSVSGKARKQLECIAEKGNGTYYDADDAEGIGESISGASQRALRPFEFTGTPVKGTPDAADAPTVKTGQYLDTIQTRGARYYRFERTAPGTTVHFGLIFEGESEDLVSNLNAQMSVENESGDLTQCRRAVVQSTTHGDGSRLIFGSTHSADTDPEAPCNTADALFFDTESGGKDTGAIAGKQVQLMVYEEPPVSAAALDALPAQPDPPTWTDLTPGEPTAGMIPGSAIANAPIVEDGTYSFDINPGENQVIGVPVGWGQHLQAQFDARLTDEIRKEWGVGAGIELDVIGPLGGQATIDVRTDAPESWCRPGLLQNCPDAWRTGTLSNVVAYRNRFDYADAAASTGLPGVHYVRVQYQLDENFNVPYTLTIKTVGEDGEGEPDYEKVSGLTAPTADLNLNAADGAEAAEGSGGSDGSDEGEAGSASGADASAKSEHGSDTLKLVAGIGGTGLGIAALAAAAVLLIRRRRA
ncbi:vWA domain-containing protein [Nocardioides panzhihuensis]|uniref:Ca-activated chloride channel family protein n=1 Tax=Nocardioides panzhihuensis TaxID=860243 RepID=A0A7Z0IUF0_9ACTN|nr:VWA domain-containing protein [Nocardioides panzhihuensis]NYI79758.1 Ca-activated chloride channel family protein [Nocardioides panzhihuensis]